MSDVQFPMQPLYALTAAIKDGTHGTHRRVAEGVPLLSAKNITANGKIALDDTDDLISESEYLDLIRSFRLEADDLLLTIVGSLGRRAIYSGQRITFQRSVAYIRPQQQKLRSRFLFHWMGHPTFSAELARRSNATAQAGVYLGELAKIAVPVPETSEQNALAQILDTLDTTIHETEAIIAKLKVIKKGLQHDLLTRGLDASGALRPPRAEAPHLYKETILGWIPNDWEVVKLASLVSSIGQGWSPDCESSPADSGCWGVLKTTAITWNGYDDQENKALPSMLKARADLEVRAEDILITRAGPASRVGVVAYVESSREKLMISDKMYRLRIYPTEVSAYIALALSSQVAQSELSRSLSGMAETQTNISQRIVRDLLILRPMFHEQAAIVDRVMACEDRIRQEENSLKKMLAFKIGLMDDLLTGRVRVTPLLAESVQQKG